MTAGSRESRILDQISSGVPQPLYLVAGDQVLAEPVAQRIAAALASAVDTEVSTHRRPAGLGEVLADLRTFSLFGGGKICVVVESAVFSDRSAAAYLIDQAAEALPVAADGTELTSKERQAAGRLLQVLHLFAIDRYRGTAGEVLRQLPDSVLKGGAPPRSKKRPKRRGKRQVEVLLEELE